ncbi:MAG: Uncharacterized protein AWT59_0343 [Candidatus Gallionella acididurans]|uniref:Uncharacterized protein n=1 Tax=Candidatus Gallionella acididurans TaxID=1796491 RepID=A0A139BWZ9_9PROT|nr:MAG: Uncharacterized protein AWT59_0343 [Candidatus Gallionella acididurans]
MRLPDLNIFTAWLLIPQTLAMGWVAALGRLILELFGTDTPEEGIPGRIVGALLLLGAVFVVRRLLGGTLPIVGNPVGNGYRFGHRLILTGNILAAALFVFQIAWHWIPSAAAVMVMAQLTSAFGYWVMALWMAGFSFLYQSTQVA